MCYTIFFFGGIKNKFDLSRYNWPCGIFIYFGFLFLYNQWVQVCFPIHLILKYIVISRSKFSYHKLNFCLSWVVYLLRYGFWDWYPKSSHQLVSELDSKNQVIPLWSFCFLYFTFKFLFGFNLLLFLLLATFAITKKKSILVVLFIFLIYQ